MSDTPLASTVTNLDISDDTNLWHLTGQLTPNPASPEELVDPLREEANPYQDYFLLADPQGRSLIYSAPAWQFALGSDVSPAGLSARFPTAPDAEVRLVDVIDHPDGPAYFTGAEIDLETQGRELSPYEETVRRELAEYLDDEFSGKALSEQGYYDILAELIPSLERVSLRSAIRFERGTDEEGLEGYRIRLAVQPAPVSVDLSVLPQDQQAELMETLRNESNRLIAEWEDDILSEPEGVVPIPGGVLEILEERIGQYLNAQPGVYNFRWVPGWEVGTLRLELASAPFPSVRFVEHGPRQAFTDLNIDLSDLSDELFSGISSGWSQNGFDAFWDRLEQRYREAGYEINPADALMISDDGTVWIDPLRAYALVSPEAVLFTIPSEALSQAVSTEEIRRIVFPDGAPLSGAEFSEGMRRVAGLIVEHGFVVQSAHPSDPANGLIQFEYIDETTLRVTLEVARMGRLHVVGYPNGEADDFSELLEWREGEPFRPSDLAERLEIALASYNLAFTSLDYFYGVDGRLNADLVVDRTPHFISASGGAQSNGDGTSPTGGVTLDLSHPVEGISRGGITGQGNFEGMQVALTGRSLPLSPDGPSITGAVEFGHEWSGDNYVSVVPGVEVPLDHRREWLLSGGVPVTFYEDGGAGWQTAVGGRLGLFYRRADPLFTRGDRFTAEIRLEDRVGGPEGQGIGAAIQYRLPLSDDGFSGLVISGEGRFVEERYVGNYVIVPTTIDFTQGTTDLVETGGRGWGTVRVERELGPVILFGGASVSGSGEGADLSPGVGIQIPAMGLTIYGGYPLFENGEFRGGERPPEFGIGYAIRL